MSVEFKKALYPSKLISTKKSEDVIESGLASGILNPSLNFHNEKNTTHFASRAMGMGVNQEFLQNEEHVPCHSGVDVNITMNQCKLLLMQWKKNKFLSVFVGVSRKANKGKN